jgi:aminomethyltransferase
MCYENGTCVDDIIVYRIEDAKFRVVINASNREKDIAWMRSHLSEDVELTDETMETAMIAVQGPNAVRIVESLADAAISSLQRFNSTFCKVCDVECFVARTGYTGEDGFEIISPAADAPRIWRALLEMDVVPCGLAARDVLRVEAGLPLYGHELSDSINPIESGLGWVVSKTKSFIGSVPINEMRSNGPNRKLVGVRMKSKIVPRENYAVFQDGAQVGTVSSGVFSPVLDCGIAFAFVDATHAGLNKPCQVEIRGKFHDAEIVSKRFLSA